MSKGNMPNGIGEPSCPKLEKADLSDLHDAKYLSLEDYTLDKVVADQNMIEQTDLDDFVKRAKDNNLSESEIAWLAMMNHLFGGI